jgi:hypothetical protein
MIRLTLIVSLLGFTAVARAQPTVASEPARPASAVAADPHVSLAPAREGRPKRKVSVMWAPLRLVVPLVEFTAEYRVLDKLGVSLTVGGGRREISSSSTTVSGREIEAGGQIRYYAIGSFDHGMEIGVDVLEENVKFDTLPAGTAAAAGGLTIGPFLGYKIATRFGFTFETQLGARYLVVEPALQGDPAVTGSFTDSKWLPILHINFGWSF